MEIKHEELMRVMNPGNTALVVWDVQNMLVNRIFNKDEFVGKLKQLVEAAQNANVPIFFTKIAPLPDRFESAAKKAAYGGYFSGLKPEDLELYIKPRSAGIVFSKHTASIFAGTPFELMLNNAGIRNIIFTGISTEIGIESSARDASNKGYTPIIVRDCVSSSGKEAHERSLANMSKMLVVTDSVEAAKALGS